MQKTLEIWFRRVWQERDAAAIDEMMVADTTAHGLGAQALVGPAAFKAFHRQVCALLHDTDIVIDQCIEADGWLAVLCTFSGTSAAGKGVSISGAIHARIADGKIREAYNHFNFIDLFIQLELAPPDSFARGLAGQPICR